MTVLGDRASNEAVILAQVLIPAARTFDSWADALIVMPTPGPSPSLACSVARGQAAVGIHDFADADSEVVDGGPAPAMTSGHGPVRHGCGRLV